MDKFIEEKKEEFYKDFWPERTGVDETLGERLMKELLGEQWRWIEDSYRELVADIDAWEEKIITELERREPTEKLEYFEHEDRINGNDS